MAKQKSAPPAASPPPSPSHTLVLDPGAHTLKAGFSTSSSPSTCHVYPNCIARSARDKRTYIGPELLTCSDFGDLQYRRAVEKGYIVNWESEKAIWETTFAGLQCEPKETNLILTEAPNAPVALQRHADEMVFEEWEFAAAWRTIAPSLNAYAPSPFTPAPSSTDTVPSEYFLVVDAGHSHTTVTPLIHGNPLHTACRRLEIGGKTLTNQLKALISRTFDVRREDWIVNEVKEDVCYVSSDFAMDLERTWRGGQKDPRKVDASVVVDYVLPDYETIKRGFARPHDPQANMRNLALGIGTEGGRREHILTLGNERFVVPELLFHPEDIGMQQDGLCGTILQSVDALPEGLRPVFLANIVVVGGSSLIPGFLERLRNELRSRVDEDLMVRIERAQDPVRNSWIGGAKVAENEAVMGQRMVTRAEYLENGEGWTRRKFVGKIGR